MKKTVFSRIFFINVIIIIISMLALALSGYFLISHHVYKERVDTLKDNANAISGFINSGVPPERLENFLYGFSRSSNKSILIIDKTGKILMASVMEKSFNHNIKYVDRKYYQDVLSGHEHIDKGTLGGIYTSEMFTLQLPVVAKPENVVIGAIFISANAPEMFHLQLGLYRTMGIAIIAVLLLSFALSFALSKNISKPIKAIGAAAKNFAKGDFSSRVKIHKNSYNITEIRELTNSFNDMAFSMEKADDIKNNFISDVSHELRTPMTTIGGFVDGILDGTIPQDRHTEYLTIVKDEITRLSSLVNSFLDVTRAETQNKTLKFTVFDINEAIRRSLISFENQISSKQINVGVSFETDVCMVRADIDGIRQVLTNLMENAVKFTPEGGTIKITVSERQQEVFVSIYNTGCGISQDDQKLIFERFYKADKSRSINRQGTGIGLYIVKDIINRHGKDIIVKSREGEYAEFTFTVERGKI